MSDVSHFVFKNLFRFPLNRRTRALLVITAGTLALLLIFSAGTLLPSSTWGIDYSARRLPPSFAHLFGTDNMGRDILCRTVAGLSLSLRIGLLAAFLSSVIALILGCMSAVFGGRVDSAINFLIDLFMGVPHLILLILIAIAMGGGAPGIIVGCSVTHWPHLTRLIRAEVMQIRSEPYVTASRRMGKSSWYIAVHHITPHVFPQYTVGLILLFPHAILHEAGITFLGYGLPLDTPAMGVMLAESMKFLSLGLWWPAFFPGLALLLMTLLFDIIGDYVKMLIDPYSARQ